MGRRFDQQAFRMTGESFSVVPMSVITDPGLSAYAFRLLAYGLGRPDGWTHTLDSLTHAVGSHRNTTRKALIELEKLGYVVRHQWREGQRNRSDVTFLYPPSPTGNSSDGTVFDGSEVDGSEVDGSDLTVQVLTGQEMGHYKEVLTKQVVLVTSEEPIKDLVRLTPPTPGPATLRTPSPTNGSRPPMAQFQILDDDGTLDDDPPAKPVKARAARKPQIRNTSGDERFEEFWTTYGKRGTKKQALAQWKKAITRADPATIITAARAYVASTPDPRYRKHGERWLRDDCWQDEVVSATSTSRTNGYVPYRNPTDPNAYRNGVTNSRGELKIPTRGRQ